MAYNKRVYTNSKENVSYEDFNRIETGIETNDKAITEHANKINVLKLNFSSIGKSATTPILELVNAMPDNSKLVDLISVASTTIYPSVVGMIEITKINTYRNKLIFTVNNGLQYSSFVDNGYFTGWEPIATTTKTSFLCTAVSGYTITSQNCYIMNGVPYVKISIVKTDGGSFNVGNHISVATLPFSSSNTPLSFAGASGGYWSSIGSAMVSGTSLVATINTSNTTQIVISGVIV